MKQKYLVAGYMPPEHTAKYHEEMLGMRRMLPHSRPRLKGKGYASPGAKPAPFLFIPWTKEEEEKVIKHFNKTTHLDDETQRASIMTALGHVRPYDLILERAWVLKNAGLITADIPQLTRRRGRPSREALATRTAPPATQDAAPSRTAAS